MNNVCITLEFCSCSSVLLRVAFRIFNCTFRWNWANGLLFHVRSMFTNQNHYVHFFNVSFVVLWLTVLINWMARTNRGEKPEKSRNQSNFFNKLSYTCVWFRPCRLYDVFHQHQMSLCPLHMCSFIRFIGYRQIRKETCVIKTDIKCSIWCRQLKLMKWNGINKHDLHLSK